MHACVQTQIRTCLKALRELICEEAVSPKIVGMNRDVRMQNRGQQPHELFSLIAHARARARPLARTRALSLCLCVSVSLSHTRVRARLAVVDVAGVHPAAQHARARARAHARTRACTQAHAPTLCISASLCLSGSMSVSLSRARARTRARKRASPFSTKQGYTRNPGPAAAATDANPVRARPPPCDRHSSVYASAPHLPGPARSNPRGTAERYGHEEQPKARLGG